MMLISRFPTFKSVGASLLMCAALAPAANAQPTYPAKPVHLRRPFGKEWK